MNQKPSAAFVAASWVAPGASMFGYLIGLWRSNRLLNEKGFYFTVLMFGIFSVVSVQKSVRDRLEGLPVTDIYYGICWFSTILSIALLTIGRWNAALLLSRKASMRLPFCWAYSALLPCKKIRLIIRNPPKRVNRKGSLGYVLNSGISDLVDQTAGPSALTF